MNIYLATSEKLPNRALYRLKKENFLWLRFGNAKIETHPNLKLVEAKANDEVQNQFLNEYLKLIGNLSSQIASKNWVATDIYSKNRFTSILPELLAQVYQSLDCFNQQKAGTNLVITGLDAAVIKLLTKYFRKHADKVFIQSHSLLISSLKGRLRFVLSTVKQFFLAAKRRRLAKSLKVKKEFFGEPLYVLKSFSYDRSLKDGAYHDPFFDVLPSYLEGRGKSVLILTHILGDYQKITRALQSINEAQKTQILPIECFLTFAGLVKSTFAILFTRVRVKGVAKFFGLDVSALLNTELKRTYNGIKHEQFLFKSIFERVGSALNIETLVLSYEHNPWETMLIKGMRKSSPQTKLIGYQHNVVPKASANMFVSEGDDLQLLPDKILASGLQTKKIIEEYSLNDALKVETACALRYDYLFNLQATIDRPKAKTILIALEGIYKAHRLINYIINELKDRTDLNVRFRFHPVLPYEKFQPLLVADLNDFGHFSISKIPSVLDDIKDSDVVVYWGTTVALEALSIGKPVIHYDMAEMVNYDPLFQCKDFKFVIREDEPLAELIDDILAMNESEVSQAQAAAKKYLLDYFFPNTEENLKAFL